MKQVISLLIVFFVVFAKYGEPRSKFMSIHGDVNLAMLETSTSTRDEIGFIYDDQFGGFVLDPSTCHRTTGAPTSFVIHRDCTALLKIAFRETPSDQHYRAEHNSDYPSPGSGTNVIIGHRGSAEVATTTVAKNSEAFVFTDILDYISRRQSEIYCNDKNHTHYQGLLKAGNNDDRNAVILFGKSNANRYEQTMKCIAILRTSAENVRAARLFTVTISDLPHYPFVFYASELSEDPNDYSREPTFSVVSHSSKAAFNTNFVFRVNASSGCPPLITMQPTSDEREGIIFLYGYYIQRAPAIEVDGSINCGVSVAVPKFSLLPTFHYYCECMDDDW